MTVMTHIPALLCVATVVAIGGCGSTDEEQIRDAVKTVQTAPRDMDGAERVCSRLTARAEAQFTAFLGAFGGSQDCVKLFAKAETDDSGDTQLDLDGAKITIRGDRAVIAAKDGDKIGLREVDGDWKIDNVINPMVEERPRRLDPRLARGSDRQQLLATLKAAYTAFAARDFERGCDLVSYGAEAQLLVGRAFASLGESATKSQDLSCAATLRELEKLGGLRLEIGDLASSAPDLAAAEVSVKGPRATVQLPRETPTAFVRQDGRWLLGPGRESLSFDEQGPSPASLKRCWRNAGARIATSARDLRFAAGRTAIAAAVSPGKTSIKGDNWRIFYAHGADDEDPGWERVVRNPRIVPVVAYITDVNANLRTVNRARECE